MLSIVLMYSYYIQILHLMFLFLIEMIVDYILIINMVPEFNKLEYTLLI